MNRTIVGIGAAVAALGLATTLTASPALAAGADGTWGVWSATDASLASSGTIAFGDSTVTSADFAYDVTAPGVARPYLESTASKGDWLNASTPPGAIFGTNGPSDTENMLILDASGPVAESTLTLTFNSPVPANELGVVVADVDGDGTGLLTDADQVTLEATASDNSALTSDQLNGAGFNFCDVPVDASMPDNCAGTASSSAPELSTPTATSVKFVPNLGDPTDTGVSGWINPTTTVKSVKLSWTSQDGGSTIRVLVSVKKHVAAPVEVPQPALASTGLDVTTGALSALALGLLGAAAVAATRRRKA